MERKDPVVLAPTPLEALLCPAPTAPLSPHLVLHDYRNSATTGEL